MRLSIDTGGTFTDVILDGPGGALTLHKAPTTPADPIEGILNAIGRAADAVGLDTRTLLEGCDTVVHGTTRATNAILTNTAAKTAFITTAGHPDILWFRLGGRERPFDNAREFPDPYVPRSLTFELDERVDHAGSVLRPLRPASVQAVAEQLLALGVKATGVCLLWSVRNPAHELLVKDVFNRIAPEIAVTLSHRINPVIREYYRASAACIDASLKPLMSAYLGELQRRLQDAGFAGRLLVAGAGGGLLEPAWLAGAPIHSINSGPSMAPLAGRHHSGRETGADTTIIVDAGGTSFDVSVVRGGRIPRTRETWLGERYQGHITGFPAIDVRTTGAGGGSIATVDSGGLLTVGPASAGSVPGPICYGRGGTSVTVTDACMVLGYLDPRRLEALGIHPQLDAARRAVAEQIGKPLGCDLDRAAEAVVRVVTEGMVHAVGEVTVAQGIDPRAATLVSGGGAAGFNIASIAARLGCPRLLIPLSSAGLSATGGLISEVYAEEAAALFTTTTEFDREAVNRVLSELSARCFERIRESSVATDEPTIELIAEARYPGQVWEIEVPLRAASFEGDADVHALADDFHALHEQVFEVRDTGSPIEVIGWRARVRAALGGTTTLELDRASEPTDESEREIYVPGEGRRTVPVIGSARITEVVGPAILELPGTTILLDPGALARRAPSGTIVVTPAPTSVPSARLAAPAAHRSSDAAALSATASGGEGEPLDPVDLAVLSSRFDGIVRSMSNTLIRSGRSVVLNTGRDFSCCVITAANELFSIAESIPIHVLSGPDIMARSMQELHPRLRPGDAFLHNSPYHGNSHAADVSVLVPVFDDDGRHRFTVLSKAHLADIGNAEPTTYSATARDVYEEGAVILPCVKVQDGYQDIADVIRMCQVRIRVPDKWWGDYLALLGAARVGEREVRALAADVGWDYLDEFVATWLDYSEQQMAEIIRQLPNGEITVQNCHDPFGPVPDGIPIKATVRISDDVVDVDLRDNPDCQPCGLNLSEATARSAAMLGVMNSVNGYAPANAGTFRRIRVDVRENCVAGVPRHPASCSVATGNVADRVANAVQRGIAELAAGHGMAENGLCFPASMGVLSGYDDRVAEGEAFIDQLVLGYSCGAASPSADGWLTMGCVGDAGVLQWNSIEIDELRFPIRIEAHRVVADTEGAGRRRGAPAVEMKMAVTRGRLEHMYLSDGTINPPLGARGGEPGARAWQAVRGADGVLRDADLCGRLALADGDVLFSRCNGGGGYGHPLQREPERVAKDVREGVISRDRAADVYAVVLDDAGAVDAAATLVRRGGAPPAAG